MRSATVSSAGTVALPLARHGLSMESRKGTVTLRAQGGGELLGRAKWSLGDGAARATASVTLTAAVRRQLARTGSPRADVTVHERTLASAATLLLQAAS